MRLSSSRRLPPRARCSSRRMVRPASPSPRIKARIAHESATATPARIAIDLGAVLRLQIGDRISLVQTACQPRDRIVDGRSQAQRAVSERLHLYSRGPRPPAALGGVVIVYGAGASAGGSR